MNNKIDLKIIIFSYIVDFVVMAILKYSKYIRYKETILISSSHLLIDKDAIFSHNFASLVLLFFYLLAFMYIFILTKKIKRNIKIDIKRNNSYLFVLLLFDLSLYLFDIKAIIYESNAFKFVIICLITNLIVYIKYKKNNIDIK